MRTLATFALASGLVVAASVSGRSDVPLAGEYVEARTASVFAGACHYGSEYTTQGREAVLAWHVERGVREGVPLAGVDVVAVVAADENLAEPDAERRSVVYLPARLGARASGAVLAWLRAEHGAALGTIERVVPSAVAVTRDGDAFRATAGADLRLEGRLLADRACCSMPSAVWYAPFERGSGSPDRIVGHVDRFAYAGEALGRRWDRTDENSAFAGRFGPLP